jgi:hypothetical protein
LAGNVMAEGSETPNGEQGLGPEGRPRRGEGDLLAERRARRAAESGEVALMRRAEAAEATVQTLERHVASLQQRLREVEEERVRTDELLASERAAAREREHELQRVKQREYAEQQLRIEAEDRAAELTAVGARIDRESRAEIERLDARLGASEDGARELSARLGSLQRQLEQARAHAAATQEQDAASASASGEQAVQARLGELERRALEIQRGLEAERAAREHSERLLESMREGHRSMELLLDEMKGILARVIAAFADEGHAGTATAPAPGAGPQAAGHAPVERMPVEQPQVLHRPPAVEPPAAQDPEMADALAAAVERLRARAQEAPLEAEPRAPLAPAAAAPDATAPRGPAPARGEQAALEEARARPPAPAPHKHSLSLIGRLRNRRKQRKTR